MNGNCNLSTDQGVTGLVRKLDRSLNYSVSECSIDFLSQSSERKSLDPET